MATKKRTPCVFCDERSGNVVFENALWRIQPISPPWGVPGWMLLVAKRHVAGPGHFNDREAATFGPMLRTSARVLEEITGALRIYSAALGEATPHFHCHLVPRYAEMPMGAKGWSVFDLERAAREGKIARVDAAMKRILRAYRKALAS